LFNFYLQTTTAIKKDTGDQDNITHVSSLILGKPAGTALIRKDGYS